MASSTLSRRRFLRVAATTGAAAFAGACASAAEARHVRVTRHVLPVRGLPRGLDGLTVAQVTDVHLPANEAAAAHALALLGALAPDVVLLTGDIVEHTGADAELRAFAAAARGRLATYALMGNWERSGGYDVARLRRSYEAVGVTLLVNEHSVVERGDGALAVVGTDDGVQGAPDYAAALARLDPRLPVVAATHAPGVLDTLRVPQAQPPLVHLAGHTHGGQVRVPGTPPAVLPACSGRYVSGWYDTPAGRLYVARGIGSGVVRVRAFCPPELPVFTLRRADA